MEISMPEWHMLERKKDASQVILQMESNEKGMYRRCYWNVFVVMGQCLLSSVCVCVLFYSYVL